MPNPLETAGNLVHDKIITKVNPKAISVGIVGAPAIRNVFTSLKERLIDEEYMPGSLSRAIGVTLEQESAALVGALDAAVRTTAENKKHEQQKQAAWQAYSTRIRLVKPYQSLRAKLLHAINPSDETIWYTARFGVLPCVFLLSFVDYAGFNAWLFVFFFVFIELKDEFQLAQFVLCYRSQQFLCTGIFGVFPVFATTFRCLADVSNILKAVQQGDGVTALNQDDGQGHCSELAIVPNTIPEILGWIGRLVSLVLVWVAFAMLWCSSRGGEEQIRSLEAVSRSDPSPLKTFRAEPP